MDMLYGTNQYETPGLMVPVLWQEIVELCQESRHIVREVKDKPNAGWIASCVLMAGAKKRKLDYVDHMSDWIGLDFDDCNWSLNDVKREFGNLDCVAYSTTNSTWSDPRWRILVRMSREMTNEEFPGVWRAVNEMCHDLVDAKTKNLNRQHYLPAAWIGGNNEFWANDGIALDVDALLLICPPEPATAYQTFSVKQNLTTVAPPLNTPIITSNMVDRYMNGRSAGGRFWGLLLAAATRYRMEGWTLTASELANEAIRISPKDSKGIRRGRNALYEAERALAWVEDKVNPPSPLEKLNNKLRFKYGRAA